NELDDIQPRTFIFAAKAAPAYLIAKSVIKLINTLSDVINNDPEVNDKIKIIFLPNYNVSIAEKIIPAADISEQISTAGFEASGTGNMKLSLNGALTVGTWDGANIEIAEHVGEENIFIFGKRTEDLKKMKAEGYNPWRYINSSEDLKLVLESIRENIFDKDNPDLFKDLYHELTDAGDFYFYLADYKDYIECNKDVDKLYQNKLEWTKKSLLNIARMGWFTSDRSINDYNENIWHLSKKSIEIN
ncbi:MAG: glycogen/starch/alpha-glucan phosphorylase, partial [Verrucomicrobiota bacterium]|nr:glycogen/starch/alpha-glucan phosphorylase [Verrucomicrobiota bacterium]